MPNRLHGRAPRPRRPEGSRGRSPIDSSMEYYPQPRPTRFRNRTAEILTTSVLVALLVLLGVGMMLWGFETRIAFAPTPTATATGKPSPTYTPDFRATRFIEDLLTQQAYQVAANPTLQGTLVPDVTLTTDAVVNETPPVEPGPDPTQTANVLVLPIVAPNPTFTATITTEPATAAEEGVTPTPDSPLATPTLNQITLPSLSGSQPVTPTPTPTPTLEPSIQETPTMTPTLPLSTPGGVDEPTEVPAPPTNTPTITATPFPYRVNSLRAFVRENGASMYFGPSAVYTQTASLPSGDEIRLTGRNETGEWVVICCAEIQTEDGMREETGWVRQVNVRPTENALEANIPEDADIDPNDVQWLPIQPGPSSVQPLVTVTPIPPTDYPLYRYALDNRARVPDIPNPPLISAWPATAQAGQAFISPVAVSNSSVLVASADNHIYSFDRTNGNQRWRYNVGQAVRRAPVIFDRTIYIIDETGRVMALEDRGNEANQLWMTTLPQPPITDMTVISDTLFVNVGQATGEEPQYTLYFIDRADGSTEGTISAPVGGVPAGRPALSDQLIFIAADGIVALDYRDFGVVWRSTNIPNITIAPVYSFPGVGKLAELFVVDATNRIFSLNANTGVEYWSFNNEEPATSLAANESILFVAGNGYVKAIDRSTREQIWRTAVGGNMVGSPLVDSEQVLVLTQGLLQFLDANTGAVIGGGGIGLPASAGGALAVSPPWIFIPGTDSRLYTLREGQ